MTHGRTFGAFTLAVLFLGVAAASAQPVRNELSDLARFRSYTNHRVSSYDRSGRNDDGGTRDPLRPGQTRTMAEIDGPGIISHIWITIDSPEWFHLKKLVLRMYWDGEATPSVEAPIGDFFGLGLGQYVVYESSLLSVGALKALNAFFPMPFRESARITVTNEGEQPVTAYYYNIDYERHASLPDDLGYFHAQYHQAAPPEVWTTDWSLNMDANVSNRVNLDGEGNYVILEAEGRGHYVGVTHAILQNQGDWWGAGDEMIFIDGATTPQIYGTGSEDYYLGAWCYGGCGIDPFGHPRPTFAFQRYGAPLNGGDNRGAEWMVYRHHTESPIAFKDSIRVTMEHGHANHRADNWYTVAYWYQAEPHAPFPALPAAADRVPTQVNTGGPTRGKQ